ncbi:MAG: ATP-binding cassette domain-containing protein [Brachymonas sp.]|nr:ATP-binding cassette domain-containing protein [Brachymonas sp.]
MSKLVVDQIHKTYGQQAVLQGVSLAAQAGDVVAIIGSSGSGKSTFLRCINFLEKPDKGTVTLNDQTLGTIPQPHGAEPKVTDSVLLQQFRTRLSMVFQHFNLWAHMSVLQNVMEAPVHVLGLSRADARTRAENYLAKVGLTAAEFDKYPSQLSGGQQQRVAIARALAMEPEVMLFDEPTSALDPELVGGVLRVMQELAEEGRTMLVVTHEMGFARNIASHVMFLHQGVVEEQGAPKDVLDNPQSPRLQQFLAGSLK